MAPDFEQLQLAYERHLEQAPPPHGLDVPAAFRYIHYKSFGYLQLGPAVYREGDAFGMPPAEWPELTLDAVRVGCEQILAWRGLSPDSPLEGVGIGGFYSLLRMFHFERAEQTLVGSRGDLMLDEMRMKHGVDGREITLFNLVRSRRDEPEPGPPCPYCGQPLRTARAKQCRACGTDWHDPSNIVKRKATSGGE